jgi:hypothetical protein
MSTTSYLKATILLSTAGTLFSGYLSLVHALSRRCAFDEP